MFAGADQRAYLGYAWQGAKYAGQGLAQGARWGAAGAGWLAAPGGMLKDGIVGGFSSAKGWRDRSELRLHNRKLSGELVPSVEANFFANRRPPAYHKFQHRSAGEHLKKAGSTFARYTLLSPTSMMFSAGMAMMASGDNIMDPNTGFARHTANAIGAETGFVLGGGVGAAAATRMMGSGLLRGGIGWLAGGLIGSAVAGAAAEIPWALAELGRSNSKGARRARKSTFVDSEHAATMRQRAQNSIQQHQMNARSAFGSEALAFHG